ncbi:methylated-DNA-[protein]-cysteine S-methyltransferase [Micrococcus cohnii]|uniref:methylated-DNA--[protein]-cysteine S-methyltransferase n=1 Tax=Micrococcus cohnii TaxID=993416 RepID=A0A7W7DVY3_9MICC|nr:methylated-DNA--[protein]-cysteine S-methyltransferase [Micrococcus cohnii]MBB4734560.1 methylated-DNA-[protein]-cysteine S-methyltransferase [Micrococcus cohnii]
MTAPVFLPELRWTAQALPEAAELTLVAVYSPEDDAVRASGVAVPAAGETVASAVGGLLLRFMDRLEQLDPATAEREMNPRPVEHDAAVPDALAAYTAGRVRALDALTVAQPGTDFRRRAWDALRSVPPGAPVTYAQLAERAGSPTAVRAVGGACATNLAAVVVPCHRVVRADGGIGQYLYGVAAKRALLEHEAAHAD